MLDYFRVILSNAALIHYITCAGDSLLYPLARFVQFSKNKFGEKVDSPSLLLQKQYPQEALPSDLTSPKPNSETHSRSLCPS